MQRASESLPTQPTVNRAAGVAGTAAAAAAAAAVQAHVCASLQLIKYSNTGQ
jgi:hypothetical protein